MPEVDYYEVLEVARGADTGQVRRAYHRLAGKLHPDRNPGDEEAAERFRQVTRAYEVLADMTKRSLYDVYGEQGLAEGFDAAEYERLQAARRGRARAAEQRGVGHGRWGERPAVTEAKPADIEAEVLLPLVDARLGCERTFSVRLPRRGKIAARNVAITARIPGGVREGDRLRLRGKGVPGRRNRPAGDVVLTVHVEPHDYYWADEGGDLHVRLPLSPLEAFRGGALRIAVPGGTIELQVPPRSQGGQRLRITGKGGKRRDGSEADLFAHVEVRLPTGEESAELERALRTLHDAFDEPLRSKLKL